MAASDIEWTEATWNPIAGCTVLSPGCTNCYAMRMAARLQAMGMAKYAGTTRKSGKRHVWTGRVNVDKAALTAPLNWKKPQRIFVNSMSDLFQDKADEAFIGQVWRVMERAHWHSFQVLTKRPERMLEILSKPRIPDAAQCLARHLGRERGLSRSHRPAAPRAGARSLRLVRTAARADRRSGFKRHPLGDCRRRIRSARAADGGVVGRAIARCVRKTAMLRFSSSSGAGNGRRQTGRILENRTYDDYPRTCFRWAMR